MRNIRLKQIRSKIFFSVVLCLSPFVHAAEPTVTARVSATDMTINSQITLALEVSGVSNVNGSPNLSLPDFSVQAAGQTSSYQWVNGQTSSLVTFNYVLTPTKTGTLQIPSLTLDINGKGYSSQPITINVRPDNSGAATASQSNSNRDAGSRQVQVPAEGLKPLFMTATVDNEKAYVGQQILLKIQFLKRPDVRFASQARYSEPEMTGFLVEPLDKQEYTTTINGARYDVTELPYALFPTSDGEFAIGSAHIELAVRSEPDPFDPNSFFQSFFGKTDVARLSTRAIPIRVRSLPANKPINFSGAVGRFKINAKVDTNQPEVGKPFNLTLTVEGVGNIKTVKEPFLPDLRGFRRYESISSSKLSKEGKFIHGSKEFKILVIPQVSGQLTIPSASFSYFNPAKGDYETETTQEISLQVKPGNLSQADQEARPQQPTAGQATEGVRVMEKDIRFLKPGRVQPMTNPFYRRPTFLLFNLIPPLFAFVAFLSRRQSLLRVERAAEYRSRGALKTARKQLAVAKKRMAALDAVSFYSSIHAAVAGYLADKLSLSASGLIWDTVDQQLANKKVESQLRSEIREIFDQADMARFATSSFSDESRDIALNHADKVLALLDDVL